jgi:hypothetical protein
MRHVRVDFADQVTHAAERTQPDRLCTANGIAKLNREGACGVEELQVLKKSS